MEPTQQGMLEELMPPRRDNLTTFPNGVNEFFPSGWGFESFDESPDFAKSNPSFLGLISSPIEPTLTYPFSEIYPFFDSFTAPQINSSYDNINDTPPIPIQEEYPSMVEDGELGFLVNDLHNLEERKSSCKVEKDQDISLLDMNLSPERKSRVKKVEGQPSKNLMAERRRRKRLNDRLSMLRSIVPKISKMDRTSILGDTIDYMKELLEKIHNLKERDIKAGIDQMNLVGNFKELNMNEILVRNPPKFDVERRNIDTRIEVCCAAKPGLLLSTVNTIEALGLDIHHCVISCFNDFSLQASCSEAVEHRTIISSEDIKQALFRNAGYGERYL